MVLCGLRHESQLRAWAPLWVQVQALRRAWRCRTISVWSTDLSREGPGLEAMGHVCMFSELWGGGPEALGVPPSSTMKWGLESGHCQRSQCPGQPVLLVPCPVSWENRAPGEQGFRAPRVRSWGVLGVGGGGDPQSSLSRREDPGLGTMWRGSLGRLAGSRVSSALLCFSHCQLHTWKLLDACPQSPVQLAYIFSLFETPRFIEPCAPEL